MSICDFKSAGGTGWIAPSLVTVILASAFAIPLASNSVQCVVTSPPFFGLRAYAGQQELVWGGAEGCGHEWSPNGTRKQSPQRDHAPDGSFAETRGTEKSRAGMAYEASLGNTCLRCGAWRGAFGLEPKIEMYVRHTVEFLREIKGVLRDDGTVFLNLGDSYAKGGEGVRAKNLCLIPHRVAIAAQDDGWIVRDDIVWHKRNPLPESVRDRCTRSWEHVLMLTKSGRYFWDAEAIKEPSKYPNDNRKSRGKVDQKRMPTDKVAGVRPGDKTYPFRNPRNVWTFSTKPYKGAHFATFPQDIPRRCILAATRPGDTVLDPFAGSGTTGIVARELGRNAVLLDISAEYVQMMRERLKRKIADTAQIEIDSGDPLRHPGLPDDCADRGAGVVPPPQGLPAPAGDYPGASL